MIYLASILVGSAELDLSADEVGEGLVLERVDDLGEIHLDGERAKGVGGRGKVVTERKESSLDGVAGLGGGQVVLDNSHENLADAAELSVQQVTTDGDEGLGDDTVASGAGGGADVGVGASLLGSNSGLLGGANGLSKGGEGVLALD